MAGGVSTSTQMANSSHLLPLMLQLMTTSEKSTTLGQK